MVRAMQAQRKQGGPRRFVQKACDATGMGPRAHRQPDRAGDGLAARRRSPEGGAVLSPSSGERLQYDNCFDTPRLEWGVLRTLALPERRVFQQRDIVYSSNYLHKEKKTKKKKRKKRRLQ